MRRSVTLLLVLSWLLVGPAGAALAQDDGSAETGDAEVSSEDADRLEEIEGELEGLRSENEELRQRVDSLEAGAEEPPMGDPRERESPCAEADPWIRGFYCFEPGKRGLFLERDEFRLRMSLLTQIHGRIYETNTPNLDNDIIVRRNRLTFDAWLHESFRARFQGRWDGGVARLNRLWGEVSLRSWAKVRVGQWKEPFGAEQLTSSQYVEISERSIASNNLTPREDLGVMVHGTLEEIDLTYQVGVFNGQPLNAPETNDDKDVAGRLVWAPTVGPVDLELQGAVTHGRLENLSVTGGTILRAAGSTRTLFFSGAGPITRDERTRANGAAYASWGPGRLKFEYIREDFHRIEGPGASTRDEVDSYQIGGSILLTGEKSLRNSPVFPSEPFDPMADDWGPGAFQLGFRWEQVRGGRKLIRDGLATGTDRVRAYNTTLSWWPNPHVRLDATWIRSVFHQPVGLARNNEDVYLLRFQVEF